MTKGIQKSNIEELIDFLRNHPNSSKFLPSVIKSYEQLKKRIKKCELPDDYVLEQIQQVISERFVVSENDLMELLNLNKEEVRSRLKFLESNFSDYFSIDRLDKYDWIIYKTKEGLING